MRRLLPLGLAFALAGLIYYNSTLPEIPLRLRLSTDIPLSELDGCIYQNGRDEFADLDKFSDNISGVGSGRRFGSRRGATYVTADRKVRITLEDDWISNEVRVRSSRPLTTAQTALIQGCVNP